MLLEKVGSADFSESGIKSVESRTSESGHL
jgi:hypothetical protein